jgi:hypothetical protein
MINLFSTWKCSAGELNCKFLFQDFNSIIITKTFRKWVQVFHTKFMDVNKICNFLTMLY